MSDSIVIVIIRAPGYAGATWANHVLGAHRDALALGPPHRLLALKPDQYDQACFLHRESCPFWPPFLKTHPPKGAFFSRLHEFSGKRVFIMNYPSREIMNDEVYGQGYTVKHIRLVRDGRANLHSYMNHKNLSGDYETAWAVENWLLKKWDLIDRKTSVDPENTITLQYENLAARLQEPLEKLSNFIGINYSCESYKFWNFENHPTSGNIGVIDTICQMRGSLSYDHKNLKKYTSIVTELKANPNAVIKDAAWETVFSRRQRLIFDHLAGERNAAYGYPRDVFDKSVSPDVTSLQAKAMAQIGRTPIWYRLRSEIAKRFI